MANHSKTIIYHDLEGNVFLMALKTHKMPDGLPERFPQCLHCGCDTVPLETNIQHAMPGFKDLYVTLTACEDCLQASVFYYEVEHKRAN